MSDETRRRLEEAGSRPVPPPDPAFAERLGGPAARRRRDVAGPARARPGAFARPATTVVGGARGFAGLGALAVVLAITIGTPNSQPGPAPQLAGPVNVTVALTDGTVVDATDGLRLPDGAVVTVGAGGYARIGDQVLHAGRRGHDRGRSTPGRPRPPGRRGDAEPGSRDLQADGPADPEAHAGPGSHAQADRAADAQAHRRADARAGSHAQADLDARADTHAHAPGRDRAAADALALAGAAHVSGRGSGPTPTRPATGSCCAGPRPGARRATC